MLQNILYFLWINGNWWISSSCNQSNWMKLKYDQLCSTMRCYHYIFAAVIRLNLGNQRRKRTQLIILVSCFGCNHSNTIYSNLVTHTIYRHSSSMTKMGQNCMERHPIPDYSNLWKLLRIQQYRKLLLYSMLRKFVYYLPRMWNQIFQKLCILP